jgi:hypothetical protein
MPLINRVKQLIWPSKQVEKSDDEVKSEQAIDQDVKLKCPFSSKKAAEPETVPLESKKTS